MKRLLITLALLPVLAMAGDKYDLKADGRCQVRKDMSATKVGINLLKMQGWIAYECRRAPADRLKYRNWKTFAYAVDLLDPPYGFGAVLDAWSLGDAAKAQTLAMGLRTVPEDDPSIADTLIAARGAIKPTPTAVSVTTGQPCACDVRKATVNGALTCILAADVTAAVASIPGEAEKLPLQACKGL